MRCFIDRADELHFLEKEYNRTGSSLVVLYGRRRVGKTALAAEFLKGKPGVFFYASEENETENRAAFREVVAEFTNNELLKNAGSISWDLIFKAWLDSDIIWNAKSCTLPSSPSGAAKGQHEKQNAEVALSQYSTRKKLLIIDEFQYLGKANAAFPSVFQRIWDTMLCRENVMVLLCGSHISMMESQTLAYSSPLYGRRTGQIRLRQIPFAHYQEFFPQRNEKELIPYYAVTGGIPKYIELFCDASDVYAAIEQSILSKSSFLYDEPNFLLRREVSEIGSYFSILKTIAAGNRKLLKIAAALEVKQTGLTKYLQTLIELDLVQREVPITENNPEKSKKGLYKINDNFIAFWFKFIFPNLHHIESGNASLVLERIRNNLFDSHVAFVYKDLCIEKTWSLACEGVWDFTFNKVGRWWNGDTEIDIVAIDGEGGNIVFGECKYTLAKMGADVLRALEVKAQSVDWNRHARNNFYILFCPSGFTNELVKLSKARKDVVLVSF